MHPSFYKNVPLETVHASLRVDILRIGRTKAERDHFKRPLAQIIIRIRRQYAK